MGYLRDTYGYHSEEFVKGIMVGIELGALWKDGKLVVGVAQIPLKDKAEEIKMELLKGYKGG